MIEKREELELVELGEVSEETKGFGTSLIQDSPPTQQPNRKPV